MQWFRPLAAAALALALGSGLAAAGGGPETTLVVVNRSSPASRRIAREYVALRKLPPGRLLFLDGIPDRGVIDVEVFRTRILAPLRKHLAQAPWGRDVDLVVYSAGFPYGVQFKRDLGGRDARFTVGSLTGFTYLGGLVETKDPNRYAALDANRYFRTEIRAAKARPITVEERGAYMRAATALQQKRYGDARREISAFLKSYGDHAQGLVVLARALAGDERTAPALEALERAVAAGLPNARILQNVPEFGSLRKTARFRKILAGAAGTASVPEPRAFEPGPWSGNREPAAQGKGEPAHRYLLSVMLGYTGERGNSVPEILSYLRASAAADGSRPAGSFYFCRNQDIRSRTRAPLFPAAVAALKGLKHKAEILVKGTAGQDGILPVGKADVLGAVVGRAKFDWAKSKSRILPGAICEHLTSFGAHFNTPGQTKISEFLRHGAAGSSGAVVEPYAIPQKFPSPFLHVYYARGSSLAEAFYQSIHGPYQLLVVGDPLCRPFARFAHDVEIRAPSLDAPWSGIVRVEAAVDPAPDTGVSEVQLWVDGLLVTRGKPGQPLAWDTSKGADGWHDVRIVSVDDTPVRTRTSRRWAIQVRNGSAAITAKLLTPQTPEGVVALGSPLRFEGTAPGAQTVSLRVEGAQQAEAPVSDGRWQMEISESTAARWAPGSVRLVFVASGKGGPPVRSAPMALRVQAPRIAPKPLRPDGWPRVPGARLQVRKAKSGDVIATNLGPQSTYRTALGAATEGVELTAEFRVTDGIKRLSLEASGKVTVDVSGQRVFDGSLKAREPMEIPVALDPGIHGLQIGYVPDGAAVLSVRWGGTPLTARHNGLGHPLLQRARVKQRAAPADPKMAALLDGNRSGAAVTVAGSGAELRWEKERARNVATVLLFPRPVQNRKAKRKTPKAWRVEYLSGRRWREVKDLRVTVPHDTKATDGVPAALQLEFRKITTKALRVRAEGPALLCEIEVYAVDRKRK